MEEQLQAGLPGHRAASPRSQPLRPPPHGVLGRLGAPLCFSDFRLEPGARGLSASDFSTPASTWHRTARLSFSNLEQPWRGGHPTAVDLDGPLGLRAGAAPVALTGGDPPSRGRRHLSGGERSLGLPASSRGVGRADLDINLFLHMFPLVSLFIA